MLCNITQNSMGQTPGGGTLPGPARGGTLPGPAGGYPAGGGVPCQVQPGEGTLPGGRGLPCQEVPYLGGTLLGGGTQVGQQKEHSIHGGQYVSCVHAGGLSCLFSLSKASDANIIIASYYCQLLPVVCVCENFESGHYKVFSLNSVQFAKLI